MATKPLPSQLEAVQQMLEFANADLARQGRTDQVDPLATMDSYALVAVSPEGHVSTLLEIQKRVRSWLAVICNARPSRSRRQAIAQEINQELETAPATATVSLADGEISIALRREQFSEGFVAAYGCALLLDEQLSLTRGLKSCDLHDCQRYFLASRTDAKYCCQEHSNRARQRRYRRKD